MQRAKPFSGKQKRQQLQAKREKKRHEDDNDGDFKPAAHAVETKTVIEKTADAVSHPPRDPNRLRTVFDLETKAEIEQRKLAGLEPLDTHLRDECATYSFRKPWKISEDIRDSQLIPMPLRPPVTSADKETQEAKEEEAFEAWRAEIKALTQPEHLNYFEQNIEVWRQLWRTLERSDVLLLITDARYPLFHFSRVLYNHVVNDLRKPIILVLNKCDLVAPEIVEMWKAWFHEQYGSLKVVAVASFRAPVDTADALAMGRKMQLQKGKKRYDSGVGLELLVDAIRELGIKKDGVVVPIPPFRRSTAATSSPVPAAASPATASPAPAMTKGKGDEEESEDDDDTDTVDTDEDEAEDSSVEEGLTQEVELMSLGDVKPKSAAQTPFVVVGTVGHPNVGKSSLINGLMGRKVVSTSRSPGHTKHFQTIFLTPEMQLMDCPGLVFPALDRPKPVQILCGLYPLAQVREFFSPLRYLAERVPVEKIYALRLPPDTHRWSPWAIAEALALQRGFTLARGGRPDIHRAGRQILRDCLDGRLVFSWPPPNSEAAMKEFLRKEEEKRQLALLTPVAKERENETEEEAEARKQAKREKKAEAKRLKRLGPGHAADPRAVARVLAQVAAAKEEEDEPPKPPPGKSAKEAERAREYAERQAAKQGRRKRGEGPLEL